MRLLLVLLLLVSCRDVVQNTRCQKQDDCPLGFQCLNGACGCQSDDACGDGEFCNSQNSCQKRPACQSNLDCAEEQICGGGECIPKDRCRQDTQCAIGTYCESVSQTCKEGCRDDNDCPLHALCEGGQCALGACRETASCPLGQRCVGARCFPSPNPSHCAECSEDINCPWHTDYCLINPGYDPTRPETGTARFCGVSCDEDPALCPSGYSCNDVVFLTQDECQNDVQCGSAQKRCILREGDQRGFCTCSRDADCAFDQVPRQCTAFGLCVAPAGRLCGSDEECDPMPLCGPHGAGPEDICFNQPSIRCTAPEDCLCQDQRCINSGRSCTFGVDCVLSCVGGGCFVGSACAPVEGLFCPALRE